MSFSAKQLRTLILCSVLPLTASADNWPRFRGPNGSGVSETGSFPTVFGPGTNVVWKTELPSGHSSPSIWTDQVFLTAYDGEKLLTLCLDRENGKMLWSQGVLPTMIERGSRNGNPASSTPTTDGKRVYAYFGSFGLVCYNFKGKELWRKPLPVPVTQHGAATSPIVVGNLVILANDQDVNSYLLAVDAETGAELWKTDRPGYRRGFSTPLVWPEENPTEVIIPGTLRINGYSLTDGKERWVVRGLPNEMVSSPVLGGDRVYVAGWTSGSGVRLMPLFNILLEKGDVDGDENLTSKEAPNGPAKRHFTYIDANKDGKIDRAEWETLSEIFESSQNALLSVHPGGFGDVSETHVDWSFDRGLPYVPSPLYYDGRIYLVKNGGIASCFNAKNGEIYFQEERLDAIGDYYSSPIAAGGKLLMISQPGTAVVLEAGNNLKIIARNKLGGNVMATPAIIGNTLYVRTESKLFAFSEETD